ncbi:hypothetical protein GCM10018773_60480 [Streptomyces candidus]|nr:hypothetical protein GCM10018773_60480 [Streptomyces candidus]
MTARVVDGKPWTGRMRTAALRQGLVRPAEFSTWAGARRYHERHRRDRQVLEKLPWGRPLPSGEHGPETGRCERRSVCTAASKIRVVLVRAAAPAGAADCYSDWPESKRVQPALDGLDWAAVAHT